MYFRDPLRLKKRKNRWVACWIGQKFLYEQNRTLHIEHRELWFPSQWLRFETSTPSCERKKQCNSGNTILRPLPNVPYLDNWSPLSQTDIETDLERICLFLQEPVTTLSGFLFTLVDLLGHTRGSNLTRHDELHYFKYKRKRMEMKSIVPTNLPCDVIGRDDLHEYSGCNTIAMIRLMRSCCCDRQPEGRSGTEDDDEEDTTKKHRTEKDINIQRVADCMPARFWESGKPKFSSPVPYYAYYTCIICINSNTDGFFIIDVTRPVRHRNNPERFFQNLRTHCMPHYVYVTREVPDFLHTAASDSALTRWEYENANKFSSTLRQWHRLHHRSEKRSFRSLSISFAPKQDILKNIDHGRTQ